MPKNGDPDGKITEASGSKLVKQSSKEARTDKPRAQGNPQPTRRSRPPPNKKGSGVGLKKQAPRSSRSVSNLNPFRCWTGSQIQVEEEPSISVAEKIAAAVEGGVLREPEEDWDRSKLPAAEKDKATKEPNPTPTSEPTAREALVGTGSGVFAEAGIGSSSRRPANSPPRDSDPLPSPAESAQEPRLRRTSSALDRGTVKTSEPVSTPKSASASRERIVIVSATTDASSSPPRPKGPPARAGSPQNTAAGSSTSGELAIACACNKEKGIARGQPGSQKSKVEARMSRGSGPGPGSGSGRGAARDDQEPRRERVVGLRTPRRANPGPPWSTEWGHDNDYEPLRKLVADDPERSPPGRRADDHANNPLREASVPLGRRAQAARGRSEMVNPPRRRIQGEAEERGDDNQRYARRGRVAENEEQRMNVQPIGDFQLHQGDVILRHRKRPNEPLIEIFSFDQEGQSPIHEHDQILRNTLQYDQRRDNLQCRARLWRATRVEVENAQGRVGQDLRMNDVGSAEINFDSFLTRRYNHGKPPFGRKFLARKW